MSEKTISGEPPSKTEARPNISAKATTTAKLLKFIALSQDREGSKNRRPQRSGVNPTQKSVQQGARGRGVSNQRPLSNRQ